MTDFVSCFQSQILTNNDQVAQKCPTGQNAISRQLTEFFLLQFLDL